VRLQHGGGEALYRDSLQAATLGPVLFGFCKISNFVVQFADLRAKLRNKSELRLAECVAATSGTVVSAVDNSGERWSYHSTQEKDCCTNDE